MAFSVGKLKFSLDRADYGFILILLIFSFLNFDLLSQFKQLPSPIYGGDYYYHLGMMNHLDRGGSIFANSQLLNETPWAPFFYQMMVVLFSKFSGLTLMSANMLSSLPFMAASLLVIYLLSQKLLDDKLMSLIPVLFFAYAFPVFKYSVMATYLLVPLFLFLLLLAVEKKTYKHYLFAGLCYGLIGITHTITFIVATIFIVVLLSYLYVFRYFGFQVDENMRFKYSLRLAELRSNLLEGWKKTLLFLFVGVLIAQLYWYAPIFVFHLQTPNTLSEYDQASASNMNGAYTLGVVQSFFFNFSFSSGTAIFFSLATLLMDAGILWLLLIKKREFKHTFLLLVLAAQLIASLHYVVTLPVLGREFFSRLAFPYLYSTFVPLFSCFGLMAVIDLLRLKELRKWITIICIVAVFFSAWTIFQQNSSSNTWYKTGRSEMPQYMTDVSTWVKANTGVNDVFISTNEVSFMLNGLTGNKVMNSRRAHSGMFVDVDRRWADSAVILYGNNSQLRSELISKYKIKYVYWEYDWITLDYQFDETGQLVGWFDPFLIRDINGYDAYLADNGVRYVKTRTWLDPANRFKDEIQQYDVLFVAPSRWNSEMPWNPSLDSNLTLVKEFTQDGYPVARIYRVN
jgi:hypothetical protein